MMLTPSTESTAQEFGSIEDTVGAGCPMEKPPGRTALFPSSLLTTTSQAPSALFVRSNVQVIFPLEMRVTLVAGISSLSGRLRRTETPGRKLLPERSLTSTIDPLVPEAGVIEETAGGGVSIVNPPASRLDCPSGLATPTSHSPVALPVISKSHLRFSGDPTTTFVAAISGSPCFLRVTEAPERKLVPETAKIGIVGSPIPDEGA